MWPFSSNHDAPPTPTEQQPLVEEPVPSRVPVITPSGPPPETPVPGQKVGITGWPNERLSIPLVLRAPMVLTSTLIIGFSLGAGHGGRKYADRYRAENAHRFPTTQAGWYLYHRSKSYHTTLGGMREGMKYGGTISFWTALFMLLEEGVDHARAGILRGRDEDEKEMKGQRDALSTVLAGLSTAGLYSKWKRMDHFATMRMAGMALRTSLVLGFVQDGLSVVRGERPAYVEWLVREAGGKKREQAVD